jgi:hypothetical protein
MEVYTTQPTHHTTINDRMRRRKKGNLFNKKKSKALLYEIT